MIFDSPMQAFLLDKEGGALELSYEELNNVDSTNKILWVHFDYSSNEAKEWITDKSGIDSVAIDALLTEETRPRTTVLGEALLIALRGVNLNPNSKPEDMISIRLFISPNLIISTRKRNLLSVGEIIDNLKKGSGVKSSSEFLVELTLRVTDRMDDVIDQIQERTDFLEEILIENFDAEFRSEILAIRRETIILKRYLSPQKDALIKLYNEKISWIDEYQRIELRETNDQLMRHIEELDTIRDKVILIQEELANSVSEQMNRKMYVLSIISAIFLPLTFLTGLLGINIGGIPGAKDDNAFLIFSFLLIIVVTIQFIIFKKKKWI
ncbi:MAG: zinc transporter ZntB [Arcobacter sp.]|jgi:zinc transporter|uniref:Zinc transporter (EcCorA_ZntB-like family) n=3 Tax=Arcobacter TaxID=28196 RepID=A0AAE7BG30_9BACT|nr:MULTISPECIES: zinc transporter ZntB [Arcobacter]MDY3201191.1 zinc transporter ZntB [Arcobacter sp.]QKF78880.1 zinc transporter (EcCorA_ZntB-like family) [Arcobacter defluvii]RXI30713.1 zinc transporter ZntB [Arcobacter defluvii]BAK74637.1 Mg2+ transporter protein [Arcobacter sp. L]